jgi:hypothetical protein
MKEIVVKRGDTIVVKFPFDQHMIDEYNELKDVADEKGVELVVLGSERDMPRNSVIVSVLSTGSVFKQDRFTGETILWIKASVEETTNSFYSNGMIVWIKFSQSLLSEMGLSTVDQIRTRLYRKKMLIENIGNYKKKQDEDGEVNFVFNFGRVALMQ